MGRDRTVYCVNYWNSTLRRLGAKGIPGANQHFATCSPVIIESNLINSDSREIMETEGLENSMESFLLSVRHSGLQDGEK